MTNEQIIFNARCELLEAVKIGTTGRTLTIENPDGTRSQMPEPEEMHTFAAWKSIGYSVKKGEKAITKITIWKHSAKKVESEDGTEEEKNRMFMKTAAFFAASQVERISA